MASRIWATQVETAVCDAIDSFDPWEAMPPGGADTLTSLDLLKPGVLSLDGQPVFFIVLFVVPKDQFQTHLRTLAAIAKFLNDKAVRDDLAKAANEAEILRVFESRSPRG